MSLLGGEHQRRLVIAGLCVHIGAFGQQRFDRRRIAFLRRAEQFFVERGVGGFGRGLRGRSRRGLGRRVSVRGLFFFRRPLPQGGGYLSSLTHFCHHPPL